MSTNTVPMHTRGPELDPTDEKARRAVKAFRSLQPTLTSYARILTKRSDVRVEYAARDNGSTDGKKIYFRPPIALGDNTPHERRLCDRRDDQLQLLCTACRVREDVLVTIYHEIAHICYDSFAPPSEDDLIRTIESALNAHGSKYADALRAKIDATPWHLKQSFKGIADLISPWMPMLVNALEDARVNAEQFKARTGTKIMFQANEWKIFNKGVEGVNPATGKTEVRKWSEAPMNAQVLAGIYSKASGYEYAEFFSPEVVTALDDDQITSLVRQIQTVRSASGVYHLSFPILARLRELGFCKSESDPQPEPEEEFNDTGEENDDERSGNDSGDDNGSGTPPEDDGGGDDEGQVTDGEEGSSSSTDEGDGESEVPSADDEVRDSGSGSDEDQQSDAAGSDGSQELQPEEQDGSDDEGGIKEDTGSSGAGQEGSSGGNDQSDEEPGDDAAPDGAGDEGDVQTSPSEAGSESGGDRQEDESEPDSDLDSDGESDGAPDEQADLQQGSSASQPDRSGEDLDEAADEATDAAEGQTEAGGGAVSDSNDPAEAGEEDDESGEPGDAEATDGSGHSSGDERESDSDNDRSLGEFDEQSSSEVDSSPPTGSDEHLDGPGDGGSDDEASLEDRSGPKERAKEEEEEDSSDPIDTGADDGQGGVRVIEPEGEPLSMGDPDEVGLQLMEWMEHAEKPKEIQARQAAEEEAVDLAIIQGIYFETPSRNIHGVREHYYDDPIYVKGINTAMAWSHEQWTGWHIDRSELGLDGDFDAPESILGPALLRMRVAFSENQRGKELRHLKAGKVDAKVLGKRAFHDDERIFRRRVLPGKRNYFVLIGMDVSGSTIGKNIAIEKMAVMAQCQLLARMGIQFAVFAHSGGFTDPSDPGRGNGFNLEIYHIKDSDEPWTPKTEERLREIGPDSANLDGHTLEFYRKYLDKVNATDKIIMYYTDGKMPAENHDEELEILQREIKMCKRKGYTLLGVGIRTDSPIRHGLDTVQVDEKEDVVKVVKHLEKRLLRR